MQHKLTIKLPKEVTQNIQEYWHIHIGGLVVELHQSFINESRQLNDAHTV